MTTQLDIVFPPDLPRQNNEESQALLESIKPLLKSQNHRVLWYLARGHQLTTHDALLGLSWGDDTLRIGDLRARIHYIKTKLNLNVKWDYEGHYKKFWLPEDERIEAMKILTKLKHELQ